MNQQVEQEPNQEQSQLEDLTVNEAQAAEVKGGPIFMQYEGIRGDVTSKGYEKQID